jgi:hypothetical protein
VRQSLQQHAPQGMGSLELVIACHDTVRCASVPQLFSELSSDSTDGHLASVSFVYGDVTTPQYRHLLQDATHIYMFDKVFSEENHAVLLPICQLNDVYI